MTGSGSRQVYSRHRLPDGYRFGLVIVWLLPVVLLLGVTIYGRGISIAIFDPRFWLPLAVMSLPALYVWQEGVDVVEGGLVTRVHLPRFYTYAKLSTWRVHQQAHGRRLSIWQTGGDQASKIYEGHTAHLTEFQVLVKALQTHVDMRRLEAAQSPD